MKNIKGVSVRQIQRLDRLAIDTIGIPSLVLMDNAGRQVAREVFNHWKRWRQWVSIFCGTGNNGGDGLVAARYLCDWNVPVKIFLLGSPEDLKSDPSVNYRILKKLKQNVFCIGGDEKFPSSIIKKSPIILDAIFGVGLNRDITGPAKRIIETINQTRKFVVAVDIPSGLDGDTGKIYGAAIKANVTVTFSFPKKGFYLNRGPSLTGRVVVADIGLPKHLTRSHLINGIERAAGGTASRLWEDPRRAEGPTSGLP